MAGLPKENAAAGAGEADGGGWADAGATNPGRLADGAGASFGAPARSLDGAGAAAAGKRNVSAAAAGVASALLAPLPKVTPGTSTFAADAAEAGVLARVCDAAEAPEPTSDAAKTVGGAVLIVGVPVPKLTGTGCAGAGPEGAAVVAGAESCRRAPSGTGAAPVGVDPSPPEWTTPAAGPAGGLKLKLLLVGGTVD